MIKPFFCSLILILSSYCLRALDRMEGFDKDEYYAAMSSVSMDRINHQLNLLKSFSGPEKDAYEGALLMKKSGLALHAKVKLSLFKSGRKKLETMITQDTLNAEYRFLRLMIQENAPKVVGYRNDLKIDCAQIQKSFHHLSLSLQGIILDYCRSSKYLKASDLLRD